MISLHLFVAGLLGWLEREQQNVIEFLREENRVLKRQLHGRRLQLCDDERRRLAVVETQTLATEPGLQQSILFTQECDDIGLLTLEPSTRRGDQQLEREHG